MEETEGFSCTISPHLRFNYIKGFVQIHELDLKVIDEFMECMQEKHNNIYE